jgi:hypothetical protein
MLAPTIAFGVMRSRGISKLGRIELPWVIHAGYNFVAIARFFSAIVVNFREVDCITYFSAFTDMF